MKYIKTAQLIVSALIILAIFSCSDDDTDQLVSDDLQNLLIEVEGVNRDVDHALVILESDTAILKVPFEIDQVSGRLTASIESVPNGTYSVTLGIFEGEDYLEDYPEARGSIHRGLEHSFVLVVDGDQNNVIIQGPDSSSDADILPIWSDRFYFSFLDESLSNEALVLSLPDDACQLDWSFLPAEINTQLNYSYMDFFIWQESNPIYSAFEECDSGCDPRNQLTEFSDQLRQASVSLCNTTDWTSADMMIILNYEGQEEDITFFMRWDQQGAAPDFLNDGRPGRN